MPHSTRARDANAISEDLRDLTETRRLCEYRRAMAGRPAVELTLESVRVIGGEARRAGSRLLTAELIWPRPGIALKTAVSSLDPWKDGGLDLAGAPWHRRILFKESVEGRFAVSIGVSAVAPTETARELAAGISAGLLKLAGSEMSAAAGGGVPGGILRVLASEIGASLAALVRRMPPVIAAGTVDIAPERIGGDGLRLIVPLTVPADVNRIVRTRRGGRPVQRRERVLAAGTPAGECVICAAYVR
jgi:hypothetical protein